MPKINNQYFFTLKPILCRVLLPTNSRQNSDTVSGISNLPQNKKASILLKLKLFEWALKESNLRPSACKADALNQLS